MRDERDRAAMKRYRENTQRLAQESCQQDETIRRLTAENKAQAERIERLEKNVNMLLQRPYS